MGAAGARTPLPFANGFYVLDDLQLSAQECRNWRPNIPQAAALSQATLVGTEGLVQVATTGASVLDANRGAKRLNKKPYFVNRNSLFRLNADFTLNDLGTIEGTGRVSMDENGVQLLIQVPRGKGYIFTENPDTLTEITDPDFRANGNPEAVEFVDGFFMLSTDAKKFIISALNDGLAYNALDFGSAESDPDTIVGLIIYNNEPFIAGGSTFEGFNNPPTTGAGFPFVRTGLFLDKGLFAPFSLVNSNNTFMWVGGDDKEDPAIWQFANNQAVKISTTAIDIELSKLTEEEVNGIFAYTFAIKGAYIIGFTLPDTTFEFNAITGLWNERKSKIVLPGGEVIQTRCRINSIVSAYGKKFVGDSEDGRIGFIDPNTFTEYGEVIIRRMATQPFINNLDHFKLPYIEFNCESGAGNDDVEDPEVRMDLSDDGGHTYKFDRTRKLGKKGEFKKRQIWNRNGDFPNSGILRLTHSDPCKAGVNALFADVV